jgi:hypothetical protein
MAEINIGRITQPRTDFQDTRGPLKKLADFVMGSITPTGLGQLRESRGYTLPSKKLLKFMNSNYQGMNLPGNITLYDPDLSPGDLTSVLQHEDIHGLSRSMDLSKITVPKELREEIEQRRGVNSSAFNPDKITQEALAYSITEPSASDINMSEPSRSAFVASTLEALASQGIDTSRLSKIYARRQNIK